MWTVKNNDGNDNYPIQLFIDKSPFDVLKSINFGSSIITGQIESYPISNFSQSTITNDMDFSYNYERTTLSVNGQIPRINLNFINGKFDKKFPNSLKYRRDIK